jgi:N-acetylglucosaminyldiphosphoundecaprenol N-acetyl-beta-D-mannosaminyltransferase
VCVLGYTGLPSFSYGEALEVADKLGCRLQARFPRFQVAGTYSPPFRSLTPAEDVAVVRRINAAQPAIVWGGIGTSTQASGMQEHGGRLSTPVLLGVGAVFAFHTGVKRQAPRWMQHGGLEWLFRLMIEPRRLWRRYLIDHSYFLWLVLL